MIENRPIEELDASWKPLVKKAKLARRRAYAPYSKYRVGSALIDDKGRLHTGCNVENSAWSTICAERTAIVKMVSRKGRGIKRIVVVCSSDEPVFPCGVCLQSIAEFNAKCVVLAVNERSTLYSQADFTELFPRAFTPEKLKG